jgi:hypothetical protein
MNDNIISDIKIDVYIKCGIMLHTGLTDRFGHTIYFMCNAYTQNGEKVKLTETGEDIIDLDEYYTLVEAKEFIEKNYTPSNMLNVSFN